MYVIKTHQIIMMVAFFLSFHRFGTTCHFMSAFFPSRNIFFISRFVSCFFLRQSFVGFCHYTCILYEYTVSMHPFTNFSESFVFLITIFFVLSYFIKFVFFLWFVSLSLILPFLSHYFSLGFIIFFSSIFLSIYVYNDFIYLNSCY